MSINACVDGWTILHNQGVYVNIIEILYFTCPILFLVSNSIQYTWYRRLIQQCHPHQYCVLRAGI